MKNQCIFIFCTSNYFSKKIYIIMISLLLVVSMISNSVNAAGCKDVLYSVAENEELAQTKEFIIQGIKKNSLKDKEINEAFGILLKYKENNSLDEEIIKKIWANHQNGGFFDLQENLLNYYLYLYQKNLLENESRDLMLGDQIHQFINLYLNDKDGFDNIKIFLEKKHNKNKYFEIDKINEIEINILTSIFNKFYDISNKNNPKNKHINLIFTNTIKKKHIFESLQFIAQLKSVEQNQQSNNYFFDKLKKITIKHIVKKEPETFSLEALGDIVNMLHNVNELHLLICCKKDKDLNELFNEFLLGWVKEKIIKALISNLKSSLIYGDHYFFFKNSLFNDESVKLDNCVIKDIIFKFMQSYKKEDESPFFQLLDHVLVHNISLFFNYSDKEIETFIDLLEPIYKNSLHLINNNPLSFRNSNISHFMNIYEFVSAVTQADKQTSSEKIASILYGATYENFYTYLRPKTPKNTKNLADDFSAFQSPLIISHQGVYNEGMITNISFENGNPLFVEYPIDGKTYPIGYTIYFPEDMKNIEAIQVQVYGGCTKGDRIKLAYSPSSLDKHEAYLARHNIMIIKLNLPDYLDNNELQRNMTQDYMDKLQFCIHHFWETLSNYPELLDSRLQNIKDIPKYLYGASFGGLTALLQAQNYSKTWDGYISHNGALSPDKTPWDLPNKPKYTIQANPIKLEDPLLVLGNAHDNNVSMRNWTNFYKKIKKAHKEHLIKSWFTYSGVSLTNKGEQENKDLRFTGHFAPDNPEELLTFSNVMLDFMKKDEIVHENILSYYINLIGQIKSYENDITATPEKLFLAEAYEQEYEKGNPLTSDKLKHIFRTFHLLKKHGDLVEAIIKRGITDDQLKKGLARDYEAWVSFVKDFMSYKGNFLIANKFEPSLEMNFTPDLLNSYKNSLLALSSYYGQRNDKRESLAFLRSMRSLFIENVDLYYFIDLLETDLDAMDDFEKAKTKWEKIKTEIDEIGHKIIHSSSLKNKDELL